MPPTVVKIVTELETGRGLSAPASPSLQPLPKPASFPLTSLSVELQLLILHHCLSACTPIVNAGEARYVQLYRVANEKRGQDEISPGILFTCKLYYREGLHILFRNNIFLYLPLMGRPGLPDSVNRRIQCTTWDESFLNTFLKIEMANFRILCSLDHMFVSAAAVVCRWMELLSSLRELQIYFVKFAREYPVEWDDDPGIFANLLSTAHHTGSAMMKAARGGGGLQKLVLTGLPDDDYSLYVVRMMARLLCGEGKLGVTIKDRYTVDDTSLRSLKDGIDQEFEQQEEPVLTWMGIEDIPLWIKEQMGRNQDRFKKIRL